MTKQLLEEAVQLTKDVLDSLEDWAEYAPTYFKEKHGYDEYLSSYDHRIKDLEAAIASWSESINCRTCTKYNALNGRCISVIKCEGGRLYDGLVEVKCYEEQSL